jgi:hypothetical protein
LDPDKSRFGLQRGIGVQCVGEAQPAQT